MEADVGGGTDCLAAAMAAFQSGDREAQVRAVQRISEKLERGGAVHASALQLVMCVGNGLKTSDQTLQRDCIECLALIGMRLQDQLDMVVTGIMNEFNSSSSGSEMDYYVQLFAAVMMSPEKNPWMGRNMMKLFSVFGVMCVARRESPVVLKIVGKLLMHLFACYRHALIGYVRHVLVNVSLVAPLHEADETRFLEVQQSLDDDLGTTMIMELPLTLTACAILKGTAIGPHPAAGADSALDMAEGRNAETILQFKHLFDTLSHLLLYYVQMEKCTDVVGGQATSTSLAKQCIPFVPVYEALNECLIETGSRLIMRNVHDYDCVVVRVALQLCIICRTVASCLSEDTIVLTLRAMQMAIVYSASRGQIPYKMETLSYKSPLFAFSKDDSEEVKRAAEAVYNAFLCGSIASDLPEISRILFGHIESAIDFLEKCLHGSMPKDGATCEWVLKQDPRLISKREQILLEWLQLIWQLLSEKSEATVFIRFNLVRMFMDKLSDCSHWLVVYFPELHYSVLAFISWISGSHNEFLDRQAVTNGQPLSATSVSFERLLSVLTCLFENEALDLNSRQLMYSWLERMAHAVNRTEVSMFASPSMGALLLKAFTFHEHLLRFPECCFKTLQSVIERGMRHFSDEVAMRMAQLCYTLSAKTLDGQWLDFVQWLRPLFDYRRLPLCGGDIADVQNQLRSVPVNQAAVFLALLDPYAEFLGGLSSAVDLGAELRPLLDSFKIVPRSLPVKVDHITLLEEYPAASLHVANVILAQYMVEDGFKNPEFLLSYDQIEESLHQLDPWLSVPETNGALFSENWLRASLLLPFVRQLGKHVYNACYGTASAMPSNNEENFQTYYSLNQDWCSELLSCLRPQAVTLASVYGHPAIAVELASQLELPEWPIERGYKDERQALLVLVSRALADLGAVDAIEGFCCSLSSGLEAVADLCRISVLKAAQSYEKAAAVYIDYLSKGWPAGEFSDSWIPKYCLEEIVDCLVKCNDIASAVEWTCNAREKCDTFLPGCPNAAQYAEIMQSLTSFDVLPSTGYEEPKVYDEFLWSCDCRTLQLAIQHDLRESDVWNQKLAEILDEWKSQQFLYSCILQPMQQMQDVELRLDLLKLLDQQERRKEASLKRINVDDFSIGQLSLMFNVFQAMGVLNCCQDDVCYDDFCTAFAQRARRTGNYNLAVNLFQRHFNGASPAVLCERLLSWQDGLSLSHMYCVRNYSKALYMAGNQTVAFNLLYQASSVSLQAVRSADGNLQISKDYGALSELGRSMVTLSGWMAETCSLGDLLLIDEDSVLVKELEEELRTLETYIESTNSDCVVGAMLRLTMRSCPEYAKAHIRFVEWLSDYVDGMVENCGDAQRLRWSAEEEALIESWLPKEITEAQVSHVKLLLSTVRTEYNQMSKGTVEHAVNEIGHTDHVEELLQWWDGKQKLLFALYGQMCRTSFLILQVATENDYNVVKATLGIIHMLTMHYEDLQEILSSLNWEVCCQSWTRIIPQLFAHLNHPNKMVRDQLCRLLCLLAKSSPDAVLFPAVVRLHNEGWDGSIECLSSGNDACKECPDDHRIQCCKRVASVLFEGNRKLVSDTMTFVSELHRIVLLRDEIWLTLISHLEADVTKRLKSMNEYLKSTQLDAQLSLAQRQRSRREKVLLMKRILFGTFRIVYEEIGQPTQSKHDRDFSSNVEPLLRRIMDAILNDDFLSIDEILVLIRQLHRLLSVRSSRLLNAPSLNMGDISEKLLTLVDTDLPIPGVTENGRPVTLRCVDSRVSVLQTKTKPKKLCFVGSNGSRYFYLLKGAENLNLDHRIMQFIDVANMIFETYSSSKKSPEFACRSYSVTPLGPRCGLIGLVENYDPIFSVYKEWQTRSVHRRGSGSKKVTVRPGEIFHAKLDPLLAEEDIKDTKSRAKWPRSILKKALLKLIDETPDTLLSKELWCTQTLADQWWKVQNTYIRSAAVVSMVGYIVGLGDRHLDNMLISFKSGEIVNIDYNLCFERGKELRVPETVPFRLTRNLQRALGISGVMVNFTGQFRTTCINLISLLRGESDTLLKLLETFIYDPLVEWQLPRPAGAHGTVLQNILYSIHPTARQCRYGIAEELEEFKMKQKLFSIRCVEILAVWEMNSEPLLQALNAYKTCLTNVDAVATKSEHIRHELGLLEAVNAYLIQASGSADHTIFTLHQRYFRYATVKDAFERERTQLKATYSQLYRCFHSIPNDLFAMGLNFKETIENAFSVHNAIALAKEFLHVTMQPQKVTMCTSMQERISGVQEDLVKVCLRALNPAQNYTVVAKVLPVEVSNSGRMAVWVEMMEAALNVSSDDDAEKVELSCQRLPTDPFHRVADAKLVAEMHDLYCIAGSGLATAPESELEAAYAGDDLEAGVPQVTGEDEEAELREAFRCWLLSVYGQFHTLEPSSSMTEGDVDQQWMETVITLHKHFATALQVLPVLGPNCRVPFSLMKTGEKVFDLFWTALDELLGSAIPRLLELAASRRGELIRFVETLDGCVQRLEVTWRRISGDLRRNSEAFAEADLLNAIRECMPSTADPKGFEELRTAYGGFMESCDCLRAQLDCLLEKFQIGCAGTQSYLFMCQYCAMYSACSAALGCSDALRGIMQHDSFSKLFSELTYEVVGIFAKQVLLPMAREVFGLAGWILAEGPAGQPWQEVFSSVLQAQDYACRKAITSTFAKLKSTYERLLMAFRWRFEEVLGGSVSFGSASRSCILSELQMVGEQMTFILGRLESLFEGLGAFSDDLSARMKWAAGANTVWSSNFEAFNQALSVGTQSLRDLLDSCLRFEECFKSIISIERLPRDTDLSFAGDLETVSLIRRYINAWRQLDAETVNLTDVEKRLLNDNPLPPAGDITLKWIRSALGRTESLLQDIKEASEESSVKEDSLRADSLASLDTVRSQFQTFYENTAEVRSLVKNFAKLAQNKSHAVQFNTFGRLCRLQAETALAIMKSGAMPSEGARLWSASLLKSIALFEQLNVIIRDMLLAFTKPDSLGDSEAAHREYVRFFGEDPRSLPTDAPVEEVTECFAPDGRNIHGLKIVDQVKCKLHGIQEEERLEPASPDEQVDTIIKEATNIDNLALMFEGWTAWV